MSIFNKINFKSKNAFSLGKPEAEAESNSRLDLSLKNLFVDEIGVIEAISNGKFIISGRKGTGKSAIVGYITLNSFPADNFLYCRTVKPIFHNIAYLNDLIENDNEKYQILYEWIIISKLIEMILETKQGTYLREINALNKFYSKYIDLFNVEEWNRTKNADSKWTMSVNMLLGVFSTSFTKEIKQKENENKPFYYYLFGLRDVVKKVLRLQVFENYEFKVLFDDLDINFNLNNTSNCENLLSLIRIAKEYNNSYTSNSQIVIFIRDDVRRKLSGISSDSSKIFGSYEFQLKWYEKINDNEGKIKLRSLVNKRIKLNFDLLGIECNEQDPWSSYVKENRSYNYNKNSVFKNILDYTFYRPRDLINIFLPLDLNNAYSIPLSIKEIKSLLKIYSERAYEEFNDEISIMFSKDEREAIKTFLGRMVIKLSNNNGIKYEELLELIPLGLDESIIEILYSYDAIGAIDQNGDQYFHFRESIPSIPFCKCRFCVPNIVKLYFDKSMNIIL